MPRWPLAPLRRRYNRRRQRVREMADASLQAARTEAATRAAAAAAGAPAAEFDVDAAIDALDSKPKFTPGDTVEISGLQGAKQWNGKAGMVVSYDEERGRYAVQMPGQRQPLAVKPGNLSMVDVRVASADELCKCIIAVRFSHCLTSLPHCSHSFLAFSHFFAQGKEALGSIGSLLKAVRIFLHFIPKFPWIYI